MKSSLGTPQLQLRTMIVVSGLLLIATLAFMASQRQLILVLFLPFGLGLVLTIMRWPSIGLIVAALSGLVVPYLGPSGLNTTMIMLALLLGFWLFDMVALQRQPQFVSSRTVWPLLAFLVASAISFGFGQLPWFSFAVHAPMGAQLGGFAVVVLSAGAFLLMANQIHDLFWLRRITWAFLVVAALTVLIRSLLPILGISWGDRIFQHVGTVFYICLVSLAFSQAVFNTELHRRWRFALGGLVFVALYVLFIRKFDDKSGWLSCFVVIVAIIGARSWRAGLAVAACAALVAFIMWAVLVSTDEYSISTRFDAWAIMGQIIKINPVLGLGFANYYWYTPLFPIRGYAVSFNSHNNYLDIIAQTGIVGLICYLWIFWEIGRLGWKLRNQVPEGFAQAYVYGALGVGAGLVVAGMLGDWVLPFFYNIGLSGFRSSVLGWLFLGGLVSIEQIVMRQKLSAARK